MKILYVTAVEVDSGFGAAEHVSGLMGGMAELHEVELICPEYSAPDGLSEAGYRINRVPSESAARKCWAVAIHARTVVSRFQPDIVYLRPFPGCYYTLGRWLKKRGIPYVCELNSVLTSEYRLKGGRFKGWLYGFLEGKLIASSSGILPVTNEILRYSEDVSGKKLLHHFAINGIPSSELHARADREASRRKLKVPSDVRIVSVVGFNQPWHGVDIAMKTMQALGDNYHLWLVGRSNPSDRSVDEMIALYQLEGRVRVFDYLRGARLAEVLSATDVGLGALGLHYKSMSEAQPMKVALYLAHGVPTLYNYEDLRIPKGVSYAEQVEGSDPSALAAAVERLADLDSSERAVACDFARKLSWPAVAQGVVRYLDEILCSK